MSTPPSTPWHLEALGLPAHADRVAVRRAYAAALRRIDPAVDPRGFAHLREAYEAARAWCEAMAADAAAAEAAVEAPAEMPCEAVDPVDAPPSGNAPADVAVPSGDDVDDEAVASATDPTIALAWRFAADVAAQTPDEVATSLTQALAEVRTQYIDAPGRFEEHLIDLIGLQRISHRAAVFAAMEEQCHWREVGHLASLGERGRWIETVMVQRDAWAQLASDWREAWLARFVRAEAGLDRSLLRDWPDVARLHQRYPAWIGLHLSAATLSAWQALFDAQSPSTRDELTRMAAPDSAYLPAHVVRARQRSGQRSTRLTVSGFVLAALVGIANLVSTGLRQGGTAPYGYSTLPADTPRQCVELYVELDAPDALKDRSPEDVKRLKTRADRCADAGHWHPPAPPR
ncbi:hypothetical protein [Luteibacter sp. ME-Dv--P-043b]|uniref:hypothetical protein n=1 Tax=Luteibacter sp. ME-Dv--P-043b TaxID=3040291 RepID=UPI002556F8B1|nr:hypothetical protein [Luteibacter sp. ME-Dv--P-043b]